MKTLIQSSVTVLSRLGGFRRAKRIMDSNFIPSVEDECALRESLNQIYNDIPIIQNQIAEAGAILANLEAKRETRFLPTLSFTEIKTRVLLFNLERRYKFIISERGAHLAALHPVRRLPLEIIGLIFEYALPETVDKKAQYAALQLYAICHRWRDAAFVTHSLWSRLIIDKQNFIERDWGYFSDYMAFKEKVSKGIREWIRRSGSLPLTIHISDHGFVPENNRIQISQKFMDSLPEKHRWKDVVIYYRDPGPDFPFTDVSLNSLESIHLDIARGLGRRVVLNNATNLKKAGIEFQHNDYLISWEPYTIKPGYNLCIKPSLPWMQLLELDIGGLALTKDFAVSILSECRDLQICKISAQGDVPLLWDLQTESLLLPPTHLPRLHRLHIEDSAQLRPLLLSLHVPNLDDLFIKAPKKICRDVHFTSAISEFVHMSGCSIRKLEIQGFKERDERMCEFLAQMTSLVELRITTKRLYGYCFCRPVVVDALQNLEILEITTSTVHKDKFESTFLDDFISRCYDNHETVKFKQVKLDMKDLLSQHHRFITAG